MKKQANSFCSNACSSILCLFRSLCVLSLLTIPWWINLRYHHTFGSLENWLGCSQHKFWWLDRLDILSKVRGETDSSKPGASEWMSYMLRGIRIQLILERKNRKQSSAAHWNTVSIRIWNQNYDPNIYAEQMAVKHTDHINYALWADGHTWGIRLAYIPPILFKLYIHSALQIESFMSMCLFNMSPTLRLTLLLVTALSNLKRTSFYKSWIIEIM